MNHARALYVCASLLVASGVALRVAPIRRPAVSAWPSPLPRGNDRVASVAAQTSADGDAPNTNDPIIGANIFSPSRTAPPRFTAIAASPGLRRAEPPAARAPAFTLLGTTIGPGGAVALIAAGGQPAGARVHTTGDVIDGARLVAITESTVTLLRPSGPLVLHVPQVQRSTP